MLSLLHIFFRAFSSHKNRPGFLLQKSGRFTFNYVNEKGARKGYGYELLETFFIITNRLKHFCYNVTIHTAHNSIYIGMYTQKSC